MLARMVRIFVIGFLAAAWALATPIINVYPSIAPNPWDSPSWYAYAQNSIAALQAGTSSYGTPGTPAYYQRRYVFLPGEVIVTGFESWAGQAPPPPGYAGEYGNALLFALVVDAGRTGTGALRTFRLRNVWYFENFFGSADWFHFAGQSFGYDLVGQNYGLDGIPGTADDIWYGEANPGSDNVPVHRLWFTGLGAGFSVSDPEDLPFAISWISTHPNPFAWGAYLIMFDDWTLGEASASAALVPEPATFGLVGLSLVLLGLLRRRYA